MTILIDATVLSNFAAIERLDLLPCLWNRLSIASSVYEELQRGVDEGYHFLSGIDTHIFPFCERGWLHLVTLNGEQEVACYRSIPPKLHRGEAMSLAIASCRGWRFLTDDRAARDYATKIGVPVAGTLRLLVRLVQTDIVLVEEANSLLQNMIVLARYHSPVTDLNMLL